MAGEGLHRGGTLSRRMENSNNFTRGTRASRGDVLVRLSTILLAASDSLAHPLHHLHRPQSDHLAGLPMPL